MNLKVQFQGVHVKKRLEKVKLFPKEKEILINGEKPIFIFRRMARIVTRLVAACYTMRQYAVEAGLLDRYLVSVARQAPSQYEKQSPSSKTITNAETKEKFTFDINNYRFKKNVTMPRNVINAMDKDPGERSNHDLELIAREVYKIPSFRKYSSYMQRMMCRIVRYMRCGKRRVMLRKGHIGYNVYFIYSGSCHVAIDKDDTGIFMKPEVVVLRKGACFGEIALLENTRRNATVVCAESTEFIVIDKDDYSRNGLSHQMKAETVSRFKFFRNWAPLEDWTDKEIQSLSYISRTEDYTYNRAIVEDSQKNEWLWFILTGKCELLRFVDLEKCATASSLDRLHNKGFKQLSSVDGLITDKVNEPKTNSKAVTLLRLQSTPVTNAEEKEETDDEKAKDENPEPQKGVVKVRNGVYLRVDKLTSGRCMGLESLFSEQDIGLIYSKQRYSLVSQGCTVIHVPRVKFREMATHRTINRIRFSIDEYPSDDELGQHFLSKSQWQLYKHGVVQAAIRSSDLAPVDNYIRFNSVTNVQDIYYRAESPRPRMTYMDKPTNQKSEETVEEASSCNSPRRLASNQKRKDSAITNEDQDKSKLIQKTSIYVIHKNSSSGKQIKNPIERLKTTPDLKGYLKLPHKLNKKNGLQDRSQSSFNKSKSPRCLKDNLTSSKSMDKITNEHRQSRLVQIIGIKDSSNEEDKIDRLAEWKQSTPRAAIVG